MEFLDLQNNSLIVSALDVYLFFTVICGMVLMIVFWIFSERDVLATLYVSSFTILHIVGLNARIILLG
jgi:hypothetical protein